MARSRFRLLVILAAAAVLMSVSAALAETIVVKPSNMNGWVADATKGIDPNASMPTYSFSNNTPPPHRDGFYMSLGASNTNPPGGIKEECTNEIWFGTDHFIGVKIADLTKLEYSTYTCFSGNLWSSSVSQPIKLVLAFKGDGLPDDGRVGSDPKTWRFAIFSPWGATAGYGGLNTWDMTSYDIWQTWDALNGLWYVNEYPAVSTIPKWQTWDQIVTNYPNATFEHPFTYDDNLAASGIHDPWKAPYWAGESRYDASNPSGGSVAFQAGCRRPYDADFSDAWWKEHYNLRGYVDMLTVGVQGVDTVFDFQADAPPAPAVGMHNKAASDAVMDAAENNFEVVLWGKVVNETPDLMTFVIDDGSGSLVKVKAPYHPARFGDYVRAVGVFRHGYQEVTNPVNPPEHVAQPTLFTDADHVFVLKPA